MNESFKKFLVAEANFLRSVDLNLLLPKAGWVKSESRIQNITKWARKGEVISVSKNKDGHWGFTKEGSDKFYYGVEAFRITENKVGPVERGVNRPAYNTLSTPEQKTAGDPSYMQAIKSIRNAVVSLNRDLAASFYKNYVKEANFVFKKEGDKTVNPPAKKVEAPTQKIEEEKQKLAALHEKSSVLKSKLITKISLYRVAVALGYRAKEFSTGGVLGQKEREMIIKQSDIVDVINKFLPSKMRFDNGFYWTKSPFGKNEDSLLKVSQKGRFYFCEETSKSGNVATYLSEVRNMPIDEAFKWLADQYSVTLDKSAKVYYEKKDSLIKIDRAQDDAYVFYDYKSEKGGAIFELIGSNINGDDRKIMQWLKDNAEKIINKEELKSFLGSVTEYMQEVYGVKSQPVQSKESVNNQAVDNGKPAQHKSERKLEEIEITPESENVQGLTR